MNIIILEKDGVQECWGALTDISEAHEEIVYGSIRAKKYPFTYKGYNFNRVTYKEKTI